MDLKNKVIHNYFTNNTLNMEKVISDYTNYINTIMRNSYIQLSKEDEEEIALDVFLALWKNREKLDINKSMSAYIGGITRKFNKKEIPRK